MEQAHLEKPRQDEEDADVTANEPVGAEALTEAQSVRDEANRILKRLKAHAAAMGPEQARAVRRKLSEVRIGLAFVSDVLAEVPHDPTYLGHLGERVSVRK